MTESIQLGRQAKETAYQLGLMTTPQKNEVLLHMAQVLEDHTQQILQANAVDLAKATEYGVPETMQDRLQLTNERIKDMADGIRHVATLPDPIGEVDKMWKNEAGLLIGKQRVPLGVIGIIYESRPNVTTDAASLCFKSGNAVILRGGKEAFYSNQLLVQLLQKALREKNVSPFAIQFVDDTSRETA